MAETAAGDELTQLFRRRQLELRADTLGELLLMWSAFDLDDIDRTWQGIEPGLMALLAARRRSSAELAGSYYAALRLVEGVPGEAPVRVPDPPSDDLTRATLRLLGPISAKKAIAARRRDVGGRTLARLSGSVGRQVLDAGRRTITASARADRAARGFRRVTDSSPCDFCAELADMGIVGADVDFAAHDHCGCTSEPAFDLSAPAPAPGSTQPLTDFLARFEAEVDRRSAAGTAAGIGDRTAGGVIYR